MDGSQTRPAAIYELNLFSNRGRSGGSQTDMQLLMSAMSVQQPWQIRWLSNMRRCPSFHCCVQQPWQIGRFSNCHGAHRNPAHRSVTMADQAVLKPVGVDMPFDLGIPISKNCKICQVFLFLRPARPFFDQALGSPQAYIPAPTAVWIHCSKLAFECEYTKRLLTE